MKSQIRPNNNGDYILGPKKNYVLTKQALQHIILGDFTSQNIKNKCSKEEIVRLAGGLHTVKGWLLFKKSLTKLFMVGFTIQIYIMIGILLKNYKMELFYSNCR